MAGSKRTSTQPKEWAKHLRPFGKKEFWSSVRNIFRSEEKEEMIQEIDPEAMTKPEEGKAVHYNNEWYSLRNIKPTEMQLWAGDKRLVNIQGKWSDELEEYV